MEDLNMQQPPLPESVEQLITRICQDQQQPPLSPATRHRLASLGEEPAVGILRTISATTITRSFDGFVTYLVGQVAGTATSSSSPTSKRVCLSPNPSRSPVSGSGLTPTQHMLSPRSEGPVRSQVPVSVPVCVDKEVGVSSISEVGVVRMSSELVALGELEFRKAFLLLSYLGGNRIEDVLTADKIREMKSLPMHTFESEAWMLVGSKCCYITELTRVKYPNWDCSKPHVYHCHVHPDGSLRFKGPYLNPTRNFLQRALGDDNILQVKFAEEVNGDRDLTGSCIDHYAAYNKIAREGIVVGLRCYRFFVFKDGGKEEKKKDPTTSQVKCYFVRMGSEASIDKDDYILSGKTIREARSLFMHADTLASLSKYMARFSLILSKTTKMEVDLTNVNIEKIGDIHCKDVEGKDVYDIEGKPLILTDGTGYISEDLASLCPKNVYKGKCMDADNSKRHPNDTETMGMSSQKKFSEWHFVEPPLLIQFRLFHNGCAVKGTLLVNKQLPCQTIQVRPSMIKVDTSPKLLSVSTRSSLEIVTTSNHPKKACLSKNLILLLSYGGVPPEFFMGILHNALEDNRGVLSGKRAALRVCLNRGGMDDFTAARMILSGIPLEDSYLQFHLSNLLKEENKKLKGGKIPIPDSYYLMGTVDPTRKLECDEVCIILENGHISGAVLVYRNPGLHFGDVHILKAKHLPELKDYVGNSKYAIVFPCKGHRSLADEMADGDYDGDMYFVSLNPQLLETFKQGDRWLPSSSSPAIPNKRPVEYADNELEDELFKLFLSARFHPSYTVGTAANTWCSYMDRLLTLEDEVSEEKSHIKNNILQLIDLYYVALDAPKKGGAKIEIPKELTADLLFPHYMERRAEMSFQSRSIMGQIYDKVKEYEEENSSEAEIWKLPCFDVPVPQSCAVKWDKHYCEYRQDMSTALRQQNKDEAAYEVIKRYKEMLYGADQYEASTRSKKEIFDEALAIYHVTYDHARTERKNGMCGFAWKVAGSALCEWYINIVEQHGRTLTCSVSALKEIFS